MKIIRLAKLTASEGFRINGANNGDNAGLNGETTVSGAGDVNGDGIDDVIIGAPNASPYGRFNAGSSYVVYGKKGGYTLPIDLAIFNHTTTLGFRIDGAADGDNAGITVSSAGDVNGDGIDDVIIGAPDASPYGRGYAGSCYVIYGKHAEYTMPINLATFNNTTTLGFRIDGPATDYNLGGLVNGAGDVNGDGLADVIINTFSGSLSYVIYGKKGGYILPIDLATFNYTLGFRIEGSKDNLLLFNMRSAGDVNGDGLTDMIAGASDASPHLKSFAGSSYVVYGRTGGYSSTIYLVNVTTPCGFRIDGAAANDDLGSSVSNAGDVNGDGLTDMIIGASGASPHGKLSAGSSYVVYGRQDGYTMPINLAMLNTTIGFLINGAAIYDSVGSSVSNAGDVNGDGLADVILGAPDAGNYTGSVYVIYGNSSSYYKPIELVNLSATTGFRIDGATAYVGLGSSVSNAGDVNGDGIDDVIIGEPHASPHGRILAGSSYVIYGSYIPCELLNNTLVIQHQNTTDFPTTILSTANLYAIDHFYHSNDSQIQFTISDLVAGKFEFISLNQTTTSFNQQQIKEGDVRFVQDGSPNLPAYEVRVTNIKTVTTDTQSAAVTFIAPPFVIGNITNVSKLVNTTFQNPIQVDQIFKDSNYPLHFSAAMANGNSLPNWIQFRVQDNSSVVFESATPLPYSLAGTTTTLSLTATNSYNLSNHADFNVTVTKPTNNKYLSDIIIGSTIGGVVGFAALTGSAIGFWRYRKAKQLSEERKYHPFANALREQLQLSGIDDFQSDPGLAFVNAIEVLTNELQLQDIDVRNMYPNDLDTLSRYVAKAIKTTVHISSSYFGIYKTINPEDIQNNAGTIARVTIALSHTPINDSTYGTFKNA